MEANLLACSAVDQVSGQVFNIACGERTSLNTLYKKICELLGKDVPPHYSPPRKGDVKHSLADISKAEQMLGYKPKYNVFQGLEKAIDWYISQAPNWF